MDINLMKPKLKGKSDKFSWNLYEFIRRNPMYNRVYYNKRSQFDGSITDFNPNELRFGQIIIGYMHEELSGSYLKTIMGESKDKFQKWSFHSIGGWSNKQFVDITDWFWKEYIKYGRCLLDKEHTGWWMGEESRFTKINKHSRKCNWCGKHQTRNIEKTVKITRREIWINIASQNNYVRRD